MGRIKLVSAFEHVQNALMQIILHMRKVSSGSLLSISSFYGTQSFFQQTVKVWIRLDPTARMHRLI